MPRGGFRVGSGKLRGEGCRERQRQNRILSKKENQEKKCAHCGETYSIKRHKYCSLKCCLLANQKDQNSFPHTCPKCGEKFNGPKVAKYCSNDCRINNRRRITADGTTEKQCPACGEWKQVTEEHYHHNKQNFDGFTVYCNPCSVKKHNNFRRTDHGKELSRASSIRNIETIRKYRKKIQSVVNERERIKSRIDPSFQLTRRMRCLMWAGLRKNKGGHKWEDLAGYSVDALRRHIEKQFKGGMNWERFLAGEIHIDHRIPVAAFNFSSPEDLDFKRCWALKNLQPMWARENISKGAKLDKPFQPSLAIGD